MTSNMTIRQVMDSSRLILRYERPAECWTEALPLGNGRLGAMVFGGVAEERFQLNEDTLWAGGPYDPVNPRARDALPEVRRLIQVGEYAAARQLVAEQVLATPLRQMPYQTLGDLNLRLSHHDPLEYQRTLDLDRAVATVQYIAGGVTYRREAFISPVDQVLVVRLTADRPGSVSALAMLSSPHESTVEAAAADIILTGTNGSAEGVPGALRFRAQMRAIATGGQVAADGQHIRIDHVDTLTLLFAAGTSFIRYDDVSGEPKPAAVLTAAATKGYDRLLADHVAEHQRLFRRVSIDLGVGPSAQLPTDVRVHQSAHQDDPDLAALYLQYARYLLICSSRPGTEPANLQGIWNDSMSPPWGSKYTVNINTQMNYWPAGPLNLVECVEPLVCMVEDLAATGAKTARQMYGARGWVCHHNTDLWRATAPIDGPDYGMWPTGGAWLCMSLVEYYRFSTDRRLLARIYPILKGAVEFFLDTLIEEPSHGWLVTSPSMSPENIHPHGVAVCIGPTMDQQILRDLFGACAESARTLSCDADLVGELEDAIPRLAPTQIGSRGQIQEWLEDWDASAPEQQHRHISHLYGLFPSHQIDPHTTPHLAQAARVTLNTRGDHTTGWAIAWRINCWARLRDGERAHSILRLLLDASRTYPNLFDAHPPFQIDGNFGGANGIIEMLLQSHRGEIHLLPALPKAWATGSVTGLRARGGVEVDLQWSNHGLVGCRLRTTTGGIFRIRYGECTARFELSDGSSVSLDSGLQQRSAD